MATAPTATTISMSVNPGRAGALPESSPSVLGRGPGLLASFLSIVVVLAGFSGTRQFILGTRVTAGGWMVMTDTAAGVCGGEWMVKGGGTAGPLSGTSAGGSIGTGAW